MTQPAKQIAQRIHLLRGQRVVLDADLAELYGVTTKRLNEQTRRNRERFPEDFMFQLTESEASNLRSQFATSSRGHGGRRYRPLCFTEHGAVMAANVLNSRVAIEASILVVRAFIQIREAVLEYADLKRRVAEIERRIAKGFSEHEQELQELRFLIAKLEEPIDPKKRSIGFHRD